MLSHKHDAAKHKSKIGLLALHGGTMIRRQFKIKHFNFDLEFKIFLPIGMMMLSKILVPNSISRIFL